MSNHIVTRDSLRTMLQNPNRRYVEKVIGRALVVLLNRQTQAEAQTNQTNVTNSVGFSHADARGGCLTAKSWLKNGTLQDWQIEQWTKIGASGYPRLCKYWKQLDEHARTKQEQRS